MAWITPRTWVAGEVVTAALLNAHLRDQLKAIGDPWASWTPSYAGGFTAIGDATVTAKYIQAGKLVRGYILIVIGASTTFNAADLLFTPPAPPLAADLTPVGSGIVQDSSAGAGSRAGCTAFLTTVSSVRYVSLLTATTGAEVSNTVPFTWATGDTLAAQFEYEAA